MLHLDDTNALDHLIRELHALVGQRQPLHLRSEVARDDEALARYGEEHGAEAREEGRADDRGQPDEADDNLCRGGGDGGRDE